MNAAWIGPIVIALAAIALYFDRRRFATIQANILGGAVGPGCVIAQAILMLILAAIMMLFANR